jgi:hypothetical protein
MIRNHRLWIVIALVIAFACTGAGWKWTGRGSAGMQLAGWSWDGVQSGPTDS